jgi:hypothetical protein
MSTFDFTGREINPRTVIETIVAKHPQAGSERWLRTFEAVVVEQPRLRQIIIQQIFAATLMELSATKPKP